MENSSPATTAPQPRAVAACDPLVAATAARAATGAAATGAAAGVEPVVAAACAAAGVEEGATAAAGAASTQGPAVAAVPPKGLGAEGFAVLAAAAAADGLAAAGRKALVAAADVDSVAGCEASVAPERAAPAVGATLHPVSDSAPKLNAIAILWNCGVSKRGGFGCA